VWHIGHCWPLCVTAGYNESLRAADGYWISLLATMCVTAGNCVVLLATDGYCESLLARLLCATGG
jgi:hypothetical protein